jgi:two-component system sensor histidine kinase TctE
MEALRPAQQPTPAPTDSALTEREPRALSLRKRLMAGLVLSLLLWSVCGSAAAYFLARHFTTQAYDRSLRASMLDIARQIKLVNGHPAIELPPAALEILEWNELDRLFYRVVGLSGMPIAGDADLPPPRGRSGWMETYYDSQYQGTNVRVAATVHTIPGYSDPLLVMVAETTDARRAITRKILIATLLTEMLLILPVLAGVWLVVGRGLAPLVRLREDIARRSDHDLSPIDNSTTPGEVRPLVDALNGLFSRLEAALSAHRRFVANAAHQLRTPLAGLHTQAELALRESDPSALRRSLEQLHQASGRSSHLINQLMSLARLEPKSGRALQMEQLDLNELARTTISRWVPRALSADIDLGFEPSRRALSVLGDRLLLEELLGNLLDNAIRYTPCGGEVTVRVSELNKSPMLSVEDTGPGIPEDERALVLERFHRGRNAAKTPGSGLGLSIVREIAQTHGATVAIEGGGGSRGTRIEIVFAPN